MRLPVHQAQGRICKLHRHAHFHGRILARAFSQVGGNSSRANIRIRAVSTVCSFLWVPACNELMRHAVLHIAASHCASHHMRRLIPRLQGKQTGFLVLRELEWVSCAQMAYSRRAWRDMLDVLKSIGLKAAFCERAGSTAFASSVKGREIVRRHIVDLAVLAATSHQSIGESSLGAVAAAHSRAILDHIARHFASPDLSLSSAARSLGISPRYLQRLLEILGTSFTAHVTEIRLQRAFTLLTAPGKNESRVCDIAMQVGFSDISHFNRLFRSRFGTTPSDVRARGYEVLMQEAKKDDHSAASW
jgi:AraC-like DNA-binding protein